MGKHTTTELARLQDEAFALHQEGVAIKDIQATLDLNYSQTWLGITERDMVTNHPELDHRAMDAAKKPAAIVEARNKMDDHASWGWLAVRFGMPESRVRKHFREEANVYDTGLRIGKGGRFMEDNGELYEGEAAKVGVIRVRGEGAVKIAAVKAEALPTTLKGLRELAKDRGVTVQGNKKSDYVAALTAPSA